MDRLRSCINLFFHLLYLIEIRGETDNCLMAKMSVTMRRLHTGLGDDGLTR
jgi:hypothetical protein